MRKSVILVAATASLAVAAICAPNSAEAQYYGGYYAPQPYYAPAPYYAPRYYAPRYYAPRRYYRPRYY